MVAARLSTDLWPLVRAYATETALVVCTEDRILLVRSGGVDRTRHLAFDTCNYLRATNSLVCDRTGRVRHLLLPLQKEPFVPLPNRPTIEPCVQLFSRGAVGTLQGDAHLLRGVHSHTFTDMSASSNPNYEEWCVTFRFAKTHVPVFIKVKPKLRDTDKPVWFRAYHTVTGARLADCLMAQTGQPPERWSPVASWKASSSLKMWARPHEDINVGGARLYIGHGAYGQLYVEEFSVICDAASSSIPLAIRFAHLRTVSIAETVPCRFISPPAQIKEGAIKLTFHNALYGDMLVAAGHGLIASAFAPEGSGYLLYIPQLSATASTESTTTADKVTISTATTADTVAMAITAEEVAISATAVATTADNVAISTTATAAAAADSLGTGGLPVGSSAQLAFVSIVPAWPGFMARTMSQTIPVTGNLDRIVAEPGRWDMHLICGTSVLHVWDFHDPAIVRIEKLTELPTPLRSRPIPIPTI